MQTAADREREAAAAQIKANATIPPQAKARILAAKPPAAAPAK